MTLTAASRQQHPTCARNPGLSLALRPARILSSSCAARCQNLQDLEAEKKRYELPVTRESWPFLL
jgi:hypothetical protein